MLTGGTRAEADSLIWRARPGVAIEATPDGWIVRYAGASVPLGPGSPALRAALDRLVGDGADEDALADLVGVEGATRLAEWYVLLESLQAIGAIEWGVAGLGPRARLIPLSVRFRPTAGGFDSEVAGTISSYALIRRVGDTWWIESPLSSARVEVAGEEFPVLIRAFGRLLHAAGMLTDADEVMTRVGWSFHDALFHARSRMGRRDAAFGARPDGEPVDPLPRPARPHDPAARITLAPLGNPDGGPSFDQVLVVRRSGRRYGIRPVDIVQLGLLLSRVAADRHDGVAVWRTYPSGGACYPLECYLAVERCEGLAPGVYRYDPSAHALDPVSADADAGTELLAWYRGKAAADVLQVVLLLTCHMERVNRRYQAVAYALVLKEVGCLFQSLYLAATAMGLAPCALGGGDNELIARVLGVDPVVEAPVGEFLIGSSPSILA